MKPHRSPSFARALIFNVTGLVLALGLAFLVAMTWQGVASTEGAARREITETLNRGAERLRILARAAEMTLESAERAAHAAPVSSANLRAVLEDSLAAFEQRPELSYLGIALADAGEYGCLERTAAGEIRLRLFPSAQAGPGMRRTFLLTERGFELQEEIPGDGYDPRNRPFYQAALARPDGGVWVPCYPWIIHSPGADSLWGFSYVKAVRDDTGRVVAVLDTDFDMPALNSFLRALSAEYGAAFHVIELGDTPRVIGSPEVGREPVAPADWLLRLAGESDGVSVERLKVDGEQHWISARRLTLSGGVPWLVVASRDGALIEAPLRRQLYQVVGMGVVIALGLVLVSARVARRFSRPLAELEERVAGFGRSDGAAEPAAAASSTGGFRETQNLEEAFVCMAVAVRQRERELSRQNSRLRSHLENTPLAVIEWDARARITSVNASAVALFRRAAPALVGQPVRELVAPADRARVEAAFAPEGGADAPRQFSAKGSAVDGREPDCEWYVTRVEARRDGEAGGCALVLDVSQLLAAEAAYRAADARFRVLFERSPAANCLIRERDRAVLDFNGAAERLLAIARGTARGRTLEELGISAEIAAPGLRERASRGAERVRLRAASGRDLHCLVAMSPVDVDGEPCHLWVAIDITEQVTALEQNAALEARTSRQRDALIGHTQRREAEEDLGATLRRLTESSAATLATARVSVWRYTADEGRLECRDLFDLRTREHTAGQVLAATDYPAYFRALGGGEVMAMADACSDPRTRDFAEGYFRPLGIAAMLDVPIYIGGKVAGVLCHEHVGGTREWTSDEKSFAVAMANLVSLALESEERRLLQEQFLRAQRMEAVGTLASGLAHDLNNILAPMLMGAALLKMKLTSERDQRTVEMIESGAQRGSGIIRQLLSFGRGIGGERTTVQLRHLIRDLGHIVQETFPRDIAFSSSVPAALWPVANADATQLHQVLLNLSVNARDAMPRGGRLAIAAANVRLEAGAAELPAGAAAGPYVRLTVADTGEGIPPAVIDRIFDPFFTTKPVGKGTGLGLSSVLNIVKSHGGFLKVASQPGAGTTFELHLPALETAAAAASPADGDQLPRGEGQLVLVVDDEAAMQQTVREILELHGYGVVTAGNGEAAVQRFVENRGAVRLVLTDLEMPVMNGVDLIHALRVLDKDLRFVVVSGSMVAGKFGDLGQLGIEHVLSKPCDAARLLQAVHRALAAG